MALKFTRLFADDTGETHLADAELETSEEPSANGVAHVAIPATGIVYVEYPEGEREIIPGWHSSPSRHFMVSVEGGFEVTTTTGESKVFGPGEWLLADDLGGKGHLTKGVGAGRRINIVIDIADQWKLPGG